MKINRIHKTLGTCPSDPSQLILTYFGIWTYTRYGRPQSRGVRFSSSPVAWEMAYNNLPSTTVQAVTATPVPINGSVQRSSSRNCNGVMQKYSEIQAQWVSQVRCP
jgi:hypothetical protein